MQNLVIGGEVISPDQAIKLVDALYDHAYDLAGQFYEQNRSDKFRNNWPNVYDFAEANQRTFIEQARKNFAAKLSDRTVLPQDQHKIYLTLLIERAFSEGLKALGQESDNRLQIHTNTQQFEGDKKENQKIMENFGPRQNLRAVLLNGATKLGRMN